MSIDHSTKDGSAPSVLVMMATYKGARFVREQIESVLRQQDVSLTLRICDDCSPDDTFAICEEMASKDDRINATQNEQNQGVGWNFMQMVYDDANKGYDYYAFCDQDDIWLPNKLSVAIARLREIKDPCEPTLYYSDIVDFDETHEWRELPNFVECEEHPMTLLFANWASGCTMVFNNAFFELFRSYKPDSFPRIHDAWAHLVARYCGTVVPDFEYSGIRRRITGENAVGELKDYHKSFLGAIRDAQNLLYAPERAMTVAVTDLVLGYGEHIKPQKLDELAEFLAYNDSFSNRARAAFTFDYYRPTLRGKILFVLRFLFGRF